MDRIQEQASKLWDLLFDDETAETYQNALNLTGTLLKEFAQLIWLTLISVFVFGAWFSDTTVKAGKSIRDWIDNKGNDTPEAEGKPIGETSKDLLEKGRTSVNQLLNQAREQLGLDPQELAPRPTATPSSAASSSASSKSAPAASASVSQPAAAAAPMAAQKPPVSAQPSAAAAQAQKPAASPASDSASSSDSAPSSSAPPNSKTSGSAASGSAPADSSSSAPADDDDWPPQTAD